MIRPPKVDKRGCVSTQNKVCIDNAAKHLGKVPAHVIPSDETGSVEESKKNLDKYFLLKK